MNPSSCPPHRRHDRAWHRIGALMLSGVAAAAQAAPGQASALALAEPPPPGRYDARLCVTVSKTPTQCGAVTADIGDGGQALVRISDIAYRLEVWGTQLGVTLFHGTMQIDGFFAEYQWRASELHFVDAEKNTRYELKLGARRFDAP